MKNTVELKADALQGYHIKGYASVWGVEDSHGDIVHRGAFLSAISKWNADKILSPIYLFSAHNQDKKYLPIGKITALSEDSVGLWFEADLTPNLSAAEEYKARLEQGDPVGLSIGYFANEAELINGVRHLYDVDLVEISLVDNPSNPDTYITEIKTASDTELSINEIAELIKVVNQIKGRL